LVKLMNIFKTKLAKRYLFIVLIVILFALSSIYLITIRVMHSSFQSQIEYRDELIAETLSQHMEVIVQKITNDTRVLASYVLEGDQKRYKSEMERIVSYEPLYLFVQAFDKQGNVLMRVPNITFSDRLLFNEIQKRVSWSKTSYISNMIELPDGRKTIAITYPAIGENGVYQGGVVAYLDLTTLSDYLKEFTIGKHGVNVIVDREGFIIGHSNKNDIGTSLSDHPVGNFIKKDRFGIWKGDLFNEKMIVAYRPLLLGQLGLITGETTEQAMAPARSVKVLLLQGLIVVFLIAIALTIFGTSKVINPILKLIKQVNEYKENKRRSFDHLQTKDELEDLSLVLSQMATELTDKERRLYYILESIPYAVITTDKDGRITTFNKGAEQLTLFKKEEVTGRYIFDLPFKQSKEEFVVWETLKKKKPFEEVESYIYDKQERKHDVRIYSSLFQGEGEESIGSILVIRDVSEIKQLEEYLKQSERLASLGQLTAGVAHEIKNPLSIVQAATEAIHLELQEVHPEHPLIHSLADDILESSDRMNHLLKDFLKLTKGEGNSEREKINVVTILDELLHLLRKKINDHDITVYRQYEVNEAVAYADKNRLTQVFLNVLLNSIQSMKHGGTLHVRINENSADWKVEIKDSGKGIPDSQLKWIFNPFYSTKPEGTGLGLSIAHEIITQHNGKIWVESTVEKGTSIYIQLSKVSGGEDLH
jgi:PAS domain S-box-containing protein